MCWIPVTAGPGNSHTSILHLHGHHSCSNKTVLDFSQYRERYQDQIKPRVLLEEVLSKHQLLFVGFGFGDAAICSILASSAANFLHREDEERHAALLPFESPHGLDSTERYIEALKAMFKKKYAVRVHFFPTQLKPTHKKIGEYSPPFDSHSNILRYFVPHLIKDTSTINDPDKLWETHCKKLRAKLGSGLFASNFQTNDVYIVIRSDLEITEPGKPITLKNFKKDLSSLGLSRLRILTKHLDALNEPLTDEEEKPHLIYDADDLFKRQDKASAFCSYKVQATKAVDLVKRFQTRFFSPNETQPEGLSSRAVPCDNGRLGEIKKSIIPGTMACGTWELTHEDSVDIEIAIEHGASPLFTPSSKTPFNVRLVPTISEKIEEHEWSKFREIIAKALGDVNYASYVNVDVLEEYESLTLSKENGLVTGSAKTEVHLAYVGPFSYVRLAASGKINPLATRLSGANHSSAEYYSVAVVRESFDGDVMTLSELAKPRNGKSPLQFWFGPKFSTSGFLAPFVDLMRRGFCFGEENDVDGSLPVSFGFKGENKSELGVAKFNESHTELLNSLRDNEDATNIVAFVDSDMLREWRKQKENINVQLRVLWISNIALPAYPWVVNRMLVNLPTAHALTQCITTDEGEKNAMSQFLSDSKNEKISRLFGGAERFSKIGITGIYNPVRELLTEAVAFAQGPKMADEKFAQKLMPEENWLPIHLQS